MNRLSRGMFLLFWAGLSLAAGCRLYNLERKLDPVNDDFLSKTRYIITREERRTFLLLPDTEKPRFIEEFWLRRDPDPDTPENEFKIEYFNRLERAGQLFIGEGLPGWLTDRGRIYILFGPPMDRITQPVGGDAYSRCQEVWYYGNFPVVFLDQMCTGSYKLVTYELSGLRDINMMYMQELSKAQADAQKTSLAGKKLIEFEARLAITAREPGRIEGSLILEIPYERIWYRSEGKKLWTKLEAALELRDAKKTIVWQDKRSFEVALDEAELERKTGKPFAMEIPISIRDAEAIGRLDQGPALLQIILTNTTGAEVLIKTLEFK
ncbi:MAG: GWxTD domain-containing protein [Candidatus Aminicenantes bacterium]|nr:GWxTD domain-containing protein [Candidatus Aminicenantes bacterium]